MIKEKKVQYIEKNYNRYFCRVIYECCKYDIIIITIHEWYINIIINTFE